MQVLSNTHFGFSGGSPGSAKFQAKAASYMASVSAMPLVRDAECGNESAAWDENEAQVRLWLQEIIEQRRLTALFQPVISMDRGEITGYEGLIRGPSDNPLHAPINLFRAASEQGLAVEVERLCRQVVLERFVQLDLPGKLFLNVSPECLLQRNAKHGETLGYIHNLGLRPDRVIIELTENQRTLDYNLLREAARHYRAMGFEIAIDDLGEGFASLRLWSELRPEYVKIDMHFIQGIDQDPVKRQFVSSIQQIAEKSGTRVVAEGIETEAELRVIKDLGIAYGQGYHIARPNSQPATALSAGVAKALENKIVPDHPQNGRISRETVTVLKLLRECKAVAPDTPNEMLYDMFIGDPELQALPVVENGSPVGLINRNVLIDGFARLYRRELFGKKPCTRLMDVAPMIVEKDMSIHELSHAIVEADRHHLSNGFIITDHGQYLGMGTGHDLVREITRMQISAARYANPLTLLPGNVPINEHVDRLLEDGVGFCACYCDLDHFKPFNDVYGYHSGDDVIQLTGKILSEVCDPDHDFIGHIGGDDFIILFQSPDWEARCRNALDCFAGAILEFFSAKDRARGGYETEDRRGENIFHPLTSLSIGAVWVEPGMFGSHHEVSAAATEVKKLAKKQHGNSLVVERRARVCAQGSGSALSREHENQ
ncbi:MAG TPA: GGDEF domain-containing protein [Sulfuricella sp.]|nr:GGDEF domain-containing protein [Sulfuricella sp.]